MNDPVLLARLRALWDDLDFVSDKLRRSAWRSDQTATRAEMLVDSLWSGLEMTLIKDIDRKKAALEKVERDLTQPNNNINDSAVHSAAWTRYARVFQESQSVLRECLEILLARRHTDVVEQVVGAERVGGVDHVATDAARLAVEQREAALRRR